MRKRDNAGQAVCDLNVETTSSCDAVVALTHRKESIFRDCSVRLRLLLLDELFHNSDNHTPRRAVALRFGPGEGTITRQI